MKIFEKSTPSILNFWYRTRLALVEHESHALRSIYLSSVDPVYIWLSFGTVI